MRPRHGKNPDVAEERATALARLMSIVRLVCAQPGITIKELSEHFGRRPALIRRDIEILDRAGIGDFLPGRTFDIDYAEFVEEGRVTISTPLELDAPVPLTAGEWARLVTALQAMAPTLSPEDGSLLPGALAALLAARGPEHKPLQSPADAPIKLDFAVPAMSASTASKIFAVQESMEEGQRISFDYVDSAGRTSSRLVRPDLLSCGDDGWTVTGWCEGSNAPRTFRLDRLSELRIVEGTSLRNSRSFDQAPSVADDSEAESVEVILEPEGLWAARETPGELTFCPDGRLCVSYRVWNPSWMRSELLSLAPFIVSVRPVTYFEEVREFARRAISNHEQRGTR